MFKTKTILVLGAGASAEFGMPLGSQLMSYVSNDVEFRPPNSDLGLLGLMQECLGAQKANKLVTARGRLSSLIPRFDSMDEVLHFLSSDAEAVELGKYAIAYNILKAERNSILFGALINNLESIVQCDSTWANKFLRIALSASRRQDFKSFFENVVVIDFNYDRVFPQYIHSTLQRLYEFTEEEATKALKSLKILHPYGSLGSLPWQEADDPPLAFGNQDVDLLAIAKRIRTYTEERRDPEIAEIRQAIAQAHLVVILGFGFHNQNIEILSVNRSARPVKVFMTVQGISGYSHGAVAQKIKDAIKADSLPESLPEEAKSLMHQLRMSISLAAS